MEGGGSKTTMKTTTTTTTTNVPPIIAAGNQKSLQGIRSESDVVFVDPNPSRLAQWWAEKVVGTAESKAEARSRRKAKEAHDKAIQVRGGR
jgi:hypothetical protein